MENIICKKQTVVLMVAKNFLNYHSEAGKPTNFERSIREGTKIHTIRSNFKEWNKRIEKIKNEKAVLSVRQWLGIPYRTPQIKLFEFEEVGIQQLEFIDGKLIVDGKTEVAIETLARNDGLTLEEFSEWFFR